jgi:anti-sigma factor RsiW
MHLTDEQLNEYLDNETTERAQIETHLASCEECAARLTALKTLFAEIESLPELELAHSFAARFTPSPSLLVAQLPTWLTLTATLQAVLALITVIVAEPFITKLLPVVQIPSLTDVFLQLRSQWTAWLDTLSTFQLPTLPQIPVIELPTIFVALTLAGVSMLWLVGNGLLLRNQR